MSRFLFSALGSAGDVHPFIAVAQALRARGHAVRILASPHFEQRIDRAGVPFVPMGTAGEYERLLRRPELWRAREGSRFIFDQLLDRLPESHAATVAAIEGSDTVLVGSTLSWGMRLVQEQHGLRGANVHLSPACLLSAFDAPVLPGIGDLSWMPWWSRRLLLSAGERLLVDRLVGPRLDAFRATLGLPPVRRILSRWMHAPELVIGAWPAWFAPAQPDWPPQTETCGFPRFDEGGAGLDPSTDAFLADGPKPIGFTPGSAMAHGERFFAKALAASAALGCRALLITPYRDQLPRSLPDGVHHLSYAPFGVLLPRLAALVHHGGIGTSAEALAAGIPQAVAPFAHDQFDNDPLTTGAAARWAATIAAAEAPATVIARRLERLAA